jgi:4-hydroxybenzoate polyprenyltransferase
MTYPQSKPNPFTALTHILRMIKISHTIFALPFAVMATFLAANAGQGGFCGWQKLTLIILCMVFARSVAMTFNRIIDAKIDARNPRTQNREIPTGIITKKQAWIFLIICAIGFIATCALFHKPLGHLFGFNNPWPLRLALPILIFICLYSITKRFTWASHIWLGASLMLSPIGAWIAISPPTGPVIALPAILLGLAVLLWTAGFDIIYACQDLEIDRRDGLHSIPAQLGTTLALWISRTLHSLSITCLLILGLKTQLANLYFCTVLAVALLLTIEHLLVRNANMTHITIAFATINGLISILLATAAIIDIL